ncbi:MAG TPA: protease modulator HflK [Candidatus Marinimicrobia bacterium]|nr:protease modulator HflK [Candidatus Neomarinimicrobiota bacterium]HRS51910.1 protease modulator HflK [Candidatus Neomarinimicrobiota bacterium]HRU93302.1 protease modulator HflK [Candidatus Neomarinimicrobiota bacterium]
MTNKKVQFSNKEIEVSSVSYWLIILIAIVLVLIVTALMSFYTIEPGETGVITRWGKIYQINEPGAHWKLPWGIDRVYRVKVNYPYTAEFGIRTTSDSLTTLSDNFYLPEARLLTGDLKMIDLQWVVQYSIQDPVAYLFGVENPENMLRLVGSAAMRSAVGDFSFHEVFQTERRAVAERARNYMQTKFDLYNIGIVVQHVQLKEARPALPSSEPDTTKLLKPFNPTDSTGVDSVRFGGNRII